MDSLTLKELGIIGEEAQQLTKQFIIHMKAKGVTNEDIYTILSSIDSSDVSMLQNIFKKPQTTNHNKVTSITPIHSHILDNTPDYNHLITRIEALSYMPFAQAVALMPNATKTNTTPRGSVLLSYKALVPDLIGDNIGCAVHVTLLPLNVDKTDNVTLRQILKESVNIDTTSLQKDITSITSFFDGLEYIPDLRQHKEKMFSLLGTLDGDNHFVKIMSIKMTPLLYYHLGLSSYPIWEQNKTYIAILTHAGSHGIGYKIKRKYSQTATELTEHYRLSFPPYLAWIDSDSLVAKQFLNTINNLLWYSQANHSILHGKIIEGLHSVYSFSTEIHAIHSAHESITKLDDRFMHRKGAIATYENQLSIVMETEEMPSYIVKGVGNSKWLQSAGYYTPLWYSETVSNKKLINQQIGSSFYIRGKLNPLVSYKIEK